MESIAALIAATLTAGTPLMLASIGMLVNERAGILNLGAEGIMLVGAAVGFLVAYETGSVAVGMAAGMLSGIAMAALFAALAIGLVTNQYATGLALTLFGGGLSAFIGLPYVGKALAPSAAPHWPVLGDLPFFGTAFFRLHPMVYGALALTALVAWMFARTRMGLTIRAVGESPESAHALGMPVRHVRVLAVLAGGACCGLAGAFLSTAYTPLWAEDMVAGRGWIALALTTFATWRPWRVALGAWIFGSVTMLQFHLQGEGVQVASQLLSMLPYLATIAVLALISRNAAFIRINMPASLGKAFHPG